MNTPRTEWSGGSSRVARLSVVLLLICWGSPLLARNDAFRKTAHGDLQQGPQRLKDRQRGSCIQCHDQHASHKESTPGRNRAGLFAPDDNDLCFTCHTKASASGTFPGSPKWSRSAHATEPNVVRSGRGAADANLCVNCHDPHGVRDENGVIPAMLNEREADLCLGCHDGSAGADVRTALLKPYAHGSRAPGSHFPHEADDPDVARTAFESNRRHVSCSDCHNVHAGTRDRMRRQAPEIPRSLSGVARVEVINGPAGAIPNYQFRAADDPTPATEYEVCFKCHSSWITLPPGRDDLARLTNPQNPSTHPIQGRGRDSRIAQESFTANWAADSLVYCSDCHGSDDPRESGLHASTYPYLLRKPFSMSPEAQPPSRGDLCFDCHDYDVYGSSASSDLLQRASRFNAPAGPGHAFHVGAQRIPCFSCHESHGSVTYGSLIAVGRTPGLMSFVQTPFGGTCTSTCHAARSYQVNYPR